MREPVQARSRAHLATVYGSQEKCGRSNDMIPRVRPRGFIALTRIRMTWIVLNESTERWQTPRRDGSLSPTRNDYRQLIFPVLSIHQLPSPRDEARRPVWPGEASGKEIPAETSAVFAVYLEDA